MSNIRKIGSLFWSFLFTIATGGTFVESTLQFIHITKCSTKKIGRFQILKSKNLDLK